MNKADISQEKILEVSLRILEESDITDLNMRKVAQTCGVAVGSIYNYFPTKSDLVITVVEEVWQRLFQAAPYMREPGKRFTEYVSALYEQVYVSQKNYHNFFLMHQSLIRAGSKTQGKHVMAHYFEQIKARMLEVLAADGSNHAVWTEDFSQKKLVDFVFANMLLSLSKGESDCHFLVLVLNHILD